ncbi:TonB-dependent siderophore myxochelin receptor MxcH [Sorangium sp. So ce834]|uniref:TonB-dependent siderophore myxochelin receptor MxcH n=1 Tax=Sorangium sp. So ce834 TaxID=3133321 RepID=UPI003F60B6AC
MTLLLPVVPAPARAQGDGEPEGRGRADGDGGAGAPAAGAVRGERSPQGAGEARIEPPQLVEGAEAEVPPEARAARREGKVVLKLRIDAAGRVTEAEVVEPMGPGFDEAARAAAFRFLFTPARRDGTPVASRILYAYEFRPPAEPPAEPPPTGVAAGPPTGVAAGPPTGVAAGPPTGVAAARSAEITPGPTRGPGPATGAAPAAGAAPAPVAGAAPAADAAPVEVTVRGAAMAERLRQSAQAIKVIETEQAKRRTADMGEVLARTEGVGVRRGGGLGSSARFSLNGLSNDQIRFFLDGVPLDFAGFPFGIANVPVNLVDRVEIYRGVVPVRLGADALGGAVNLVTDQDVRGTHGAASYEIGSFDTHRLAATARHLHEPSGFLARVNGFLDYARNDYRVTVDVPDDDLVEHPERVYRFHDAYRAAGGGVELGFVNRPWARRLLLRVFLTAYDKEHQHKLGVMKVPYGEVTSGETTAGVTLRYEQPLGRGVALEAIGGYAYGRATFLDVSECTYDWYGHCNPGGKPGEDDTKPRDQVFWEHSGYGRLNLRFRPHPEHALQLSVSPMFVTRTGDERRQANPEGRDPLTADRELVNWVHGAEHQLNLLDDRVENVLFVKQYVQLLRSEESLQGLADRFRRRDRDTHRLGVGDGLRYRFSEWLYAKASYEWARRLPRPDEVFGDGALIRAKLDLSPETSHNGNLGVTIDAPGTAAGAWRLEANGYLRAAEDLIVLLGDGKISQYDNVFSARALGVEASARWTSPGEHVVLDGNVTYEDFRNTSEEGTFGRYAGQRMPNRPWLFANGSARVQLREVAAPRDELALTWDTRYVHGYFLGWERNGRRDDKARVPSQLLHSLALTYIARLAPRTLSFTVEAHNLTDEPAFDFYGVQRPGRAFFSKAMLEM